MIRFSHWAFRVSVMTLSILLLNACNSKGQSSKSLDSPDWQQFKTLAARYDSMAVAFQKREKEDPEFAANPMAVAGDDIQKFYALMQQMGESVPKDLSSVKDVEGYGSTDLHALKLAALISEKMSLVPDIDRKLLSYTSDPDSVRDLKMEIAQLAITSGDIEEAEKYATDEVLENAEPMQRAALYSGFSTAYLESKDFPAARTWALKAVSGYADAARDIEKKGNADPRQAQWITGRYGAILAPLMYELKEAGDASGLDKLTADARELLPEGTDWGTVQASINGNMKELARERETINQPAPAWAEHEWIGSEPLSLPQLKGKVVLVDFFATWCKPCIRAFPHLREWKNKYEKDGLVVVGLTTYQGRYDGATVKPEEEMKKLKDDFIPKHDITWPIGVEKSGRKTMQDYNVSGIPHVVLIDREGKVQYVKVGAADFDKTERKIKDLLGL